MKYKNQPYIFSAQFGSCNLTPCRDHHQSQIPPVTTPGSFRILSITQTQKLFIQNIFQTLIQNDYTRKRRKMNNMSLCLTRATFICQFVTESNPEVGGTKSRQTFPIPVSSKLWLFIETIWKGRKCMCIKFIL